MKAVFSFIKNIFSKKQKTEKGTLDMPEKPTTSPMKIALIVGHGNGDSGATCFNKMSEYDYNSLVARLVKDEATGKEIKIFHRTSTGILGVATKVVAWNPDVSIELHLNAFNGSASGCEVLCLDGDEQSAIMGRSFAKSFTVVFGRKLRGDKGIKWLGNRDRGAASLAACRPIKRSILVEPFFCDNKAEWIDPLTYASFMKEWINEQ